VSAQLFQLRSIEQNELAIVADHQNKAILLFTGVTIVFLPLSFFTSYFGMNLEGLQNNDKTEAYFWKVCGTIGFAIMLAVTLWIGRHRVFRQIQRVAMAPV
jgi:Mg2+ and Co2+ transporter CorA